MKTKTVLHEIVSRAKARVTSDKSTRSFSELKKRIKSAPNVISFANAIGSGFGLIAEIKRKSPSQGEMLNHNVLEIARLYDEHSLVHALSILTNRDDFAMDISDLCRIRKLTGKPILRKDFIFDEYQVYEARAYGADAILLMASVLKSASRLKQLFDLSTSLGMDVLFECKSEKEISLIPSGAKIYGINSRNMKAHSLSYRWARLLSGLPFRDQSIQFSSFDLIKHLPKNAIKVAESGLAYRDISSIRDRHGYDAALVGTAILNDPAGVEVALHNFSKSLLLRELQPCWSARRLSDVIPV